MRKSTVFISSILTTFALVMLYGVVSAYRGNLNITEATSQPATAIPVAESVIPAPTQIIVTPEQAAQLAVQVIGHDNLLSAETANINGVDAYKITFTNNDVVYVGIDGQILSVQVAPVVVSVEAPARSKKNNQSSNKNDGESHDDHEEHDD